MIQGEIHTFPLLDLIQWLALTRRTGRLVIAEGADNVQLYPAKGEIAVKKLPAISSSRLSAEFYFSDGKIAAASICGRSATNSVEQVRTLLGTVFRWRSGRFVFNAYPLALEGALNNLGLSTEALLQDVAARLDQGQKPDEEPSLDEWAKAGAHVETFKLADALRLQVVDKMLSEDFNVPAMPQLAVRVLELTRDENFSLRDLGNLVHQDQAVAAQVLRYANSVLRGAGRKVDSLALAVQRLGADEVVNIVLAASLQARRLGHDPFAAEKRRLWAHSSTAAFIAQALAARVRLNGNLGFLCGLLMDFGMNVLYSLIQTLLVRRSSSDPIPAQLIKEIIWDYHPRVGRTVGEKWRLPAPVIESMTYHHCLDGVSSDHSYVAVSALADRLATFALSTPRAALEEALSRFLPERLASHPAAQLINLNTDKAAAVLGDLPRNLDQALEFVVD